MPNNYDFSKIDNIKELMINPSGWVYPLYIEYGLGYHGELLSYFWRVKGTNHTFIIPVIRIDYLTGGEYNLHFKEVLESFRDDYIGWAKEKWYTSWMKEYHNEFNKFIIL
jgi:hypothetical protein